jgi:hypothetical protein
MTTKVNTAIKSLDEMLQAFYEHNPRQHSLDTDIIPLAERMLKAGWCEHVTFNTRNNRIVDGHGRVLAAQWLSERSPDWFDMRLAEQSLSNPNDPYLGRYFPFYWTQIPVILTDLDSNAHGAIAIGLNTEKSCGTDNPVKIDALLRKMDRKSRELAGFKAKIKEAIETVTPHFEAIVSDEDDYQEAKQHFELPTATDYSVGMDESDNDAEFYSGEVSSNFEYDQELPEPLPKKEPEKTMLNLSLSWLDWKKFKAWQKANACENESQAFWKGMQMVMEQIL